jgi:hypothetical protein
MSPHYTHYLLKGLLFGLFPGTLLPFQALT